jgi:hypothetical protein
MFEIREQDHLALIYSDGIVPEPPHGTSAVPDAFLLPDWGSMTPEK